MSNTTKKFAGLDALQTFLDNCKTLFANITHKHTMSDIEDYVVDTELSSTSNNPVQNAVITESITTLSSTVAYIDTESNDTVMTEAEAQARMEAIEYGRY